VLSASDETFSLCSGELSASDETFSLGSVELSASDEASFSNEKVEWLFKTVKN